MFTGSGGLASREILYYLQNFGFVLIVSCVVSMPVFPALKKKLSDAKPVTRRVLGGCWIAAMCVMLAVAISYMVADTYNPFLYFRF